MRDGNAKRTLEYIAAHPDQTREQIMRAVGLNKTQTSNVLWQLKADRLIECEFAGRFSKWSIAGSKRKVVNSVFALGTQA